jgi:pimeloyl-ACP methyl ester carboxylesterase
MKYALLLLLLAGAVHAAEYKTLAGGVEADQGVLMVPENRAKPDSRRIRIEYLRLHARTKTPRAPLFFLQGGPGSRAVSTSDGTVKFWTPFLDVCDVVLIDQRGTNDSLVTWDWDGPPPMDFFVSAQAAGKHVDEMTRRARAAFRKRGVDLAGYTSVESADDLDALRGALGYDRVSLLGFSYGTHLAEAYMKRHGDRLENVLLFGVENLWETDKLPSTADGALQRLALLAHDDPKIAAKIPDLVALYDRVMAKLAKQPMLVPVPSPRGDTLQAPVGPFGLAFILRVDLGDATDLPVFPRLLWSIDQGDNRVLAWFVRKRAGVAIGVHGMGTAMDEASGTSAARRALIDEQAKTSRFGEVVNFPGPFATERLSENDLGDAYRAPVASNVRTLIVSGELDFNTPPWQGEELRWGLPNATHLVVLHAGHEQTLWQNETAVPVVLDFLRGQDVSRRMITYPPLTFIPLEGPDPRHPSVPR